MLKTVWENYECKEKMDIITSFHVFEHLTNPIKAFEKAVSWLNLHRGSKFGQFIKP